MRGRQVAGTPGARSLATGVGGVTLAAGGAADLGDIARFQTRAWQSSYRGLLPREYLDSLSVDAAESEWRNYLEAGSRTIAVARLSADIVGVVSWGPADFPADGIPDLELKSIYLDEAVKGTGLGTALLETALGGRSAQLWMFEGNARAEAFYRKNGFAPDGGRLLDEAAGTWELRYVR